MTPALVLSAVLTYGPTVLPLIQQLAEMVRSGKKEVTPEDLAMLVALSNKTADDYLKEAGVKL
tara:strand:- start:346 stop:534 length:189 start_codon:yes stop_codon:yes gene_type:complete